MDISLDKGIIKNRYPNLAGKDWIRRLEPEDRDFLIQVGMAAWDYGKLGGVACARTARRDDKGRFTTEKQCTLND